MPARTPAEIHTQFVEAFNAADLDGLLQLYEPSAVLLANGEPVTGHEAIREALSGWLEMKGQMTMKTRIVLESGDGLALLHGGWLIEAGGPGRGVALRGMSSEVVRRQPNGTWLFVLDNPFTPEL